MKSKVKNLVVLATLLFSLDLAHKDPDFRRNNFEQIACVCLYSCSQIKEDDDDGADKQDKNDQNAKKSKK
jgi:hypothetical protein